MFDKMAKQQKRIKIHYGLLAYEVYLILEKSIALRCISPNIFMWLLQIKRIRLLQDKLVKNIIS